MEYRHTKDFEIDGHLDIFIAGNEETTQAVKPEAFSVLIHGDKKGLKSFAELLLYLADLDQETVADKFLPAGAREHTILRPNRELSKSSCETIIGRLDAKGTGQYYATFIPKNGTASAEKSEAKN